MKKIINFIIISISFFSCSTNSFSDTKLLLETNKDTYHINEKFELTITIYPKKKKKTIRFYKNFKNLNISFIPLEQEFNKELKNHFIEGPRLFGNESEYIDEYTVTEKKPFKKTLYGTISETKTKILIEIPELKLNERLDKSILLENPKIIIKGNCRTVYGSKEESFISKKIEILIKEKSTFN